MQKKFIPFFKEISKSEKFLNVHEEILIKYAKDTQIKYKKIISHIESKEPISVYSHMGYYLHAFTLSVHYIYNFPNISQNEDKDLYYKIMCDICDKGGDTDTNCAIVGTLIGPLIGYKNFNKDLFKIFIEFIPSRRSQFTSAFIYEYVNYLEQNTLNKDKNEANKNDKMFHYTAFKMIENFLNKNIYGNTNK